MSTAKEADRIIVMEDGKVMESGTHESLISNEGAYARLYRMYGADPELVAKAAAVEAKPC